MRSALSGTKRKDGRWAITLTLTQINGKKVRKVIYGKTQKEVQQNARSILNQTGRTAHEKHSVAELIEVYKAERWPHMEKGTCRQHGPAYKKIEPFFRGDDLRAIDAPKISRWMKALSKEVGGRTVQAYRNVFSVLLAYSIELGWRNDNPAKGLDLPAGISAKPKSRPRLTPNGYRAILEEETQEVLRDLWEFLGETGMRPSEALKTHRTDIFYNLDMYWVRGGMKTEAGKGREVPIPDKLAHRLMDRETWLFPFPESDRPYNYRHVLDLWNEVCAKAEIPEGTNPYQLRKLAVSRWFANGLPDDVIEALVGHTDIHLTREVYNRVGRERLIGSVFSGCEGASVALVKVSDFNQ